MLNKYLEKTLNKPITNIQSVSGGCIADSFLISTENKQQYFLKTANHFSPFQEEANGLNEIAKSSTIKTPNIIHVDNQHLILEYIQPGQTDINFFKRFGKQLAKMHQYSHDNFGFYENNYIGSSEQINLPQSNNWAEFYYQNRIVFQLKLAEKNSFATKELSLAIHNLENKIESILSGSEEPPALIHGDLWSGNFIAGPNQTPYLIDPAVYYSHREAELAMSSLFGGFPFEFYESYQQTYPLKKGYARRRPLYQLYHVLNHLNIFGQSYYRDAMVILKGYT